MLYQYFDAQERKIQDEIDMLENRVASRLSDDDIKRLAFLRQQRDIYRKVFHDLLELVVDI